MEYHLTRERNEILTHDTTWANLKTTVLSERSQMEETIHFMFPFSLEKANLLRQKTDWQLPRAGRWEHGLTAHGTREISGLTKV